MRDRDMDDLLDFAARARPAPSPGLMDRVLTDALAEQMQAAITVRPPPRPEPGWLSRLAGAFGGGAMLTGVCSSVIFGLAIGYLNPTTLDYLTGGLAGAEVMDLFPSSDFLTAEG